MKFILAFDSYKHALRSPEVCRAFADGLRDALPDAEIIEQPMADGGEGTVEAAAAAGGERCGIPCTGPRGGAVRGEALILPDGSAVLEVAAACGIELIPRSEFDPMVTTSYGVGEMLRLLAARGVRKFVVGLGGSVTVDGGIGMLQALGWRFLRADGAEIPAPAGGGALRQVARILPPECRPDWEITLASDVENPLTGEHGAPLVFGPQKGATPEMVLLLDAGLGAWRQLWAADDCPGDGAAGGLGFAFRVALQARRRSGAELLLDLVNFDRHLVDADWVVTGEGRSDAQTACGKLPVIVARRAARHQVPTVLFSGALAADAECLRSDFAALFSLAAGPGSLEDALKGTAENLRRAGCNLGGILKYSPGAR